MKSKQSDNGTEYKSKRKTGYRDYIVFGVIVLLTVIAGIKNIELPGVYFDSAITDYLAAFVVNPSALGEKTTMSHVGLPLLGGIYHGSLSMFLQLPILLIFEASPATLRVPYLLYYAISTYILYKILEKLTNRKIAFGTAVVWTVMIYGTTLSRTQYDIMLPGLIFFLMAVFIFVSKGDVLCSTDEKSTVKAEKYCFLMGFSMGMAFYGYFCFIFLAPVFMIFIWILQKKNRGWTETAFITGLIAGSCLYFFGYADSLLTNVLGHETITKLALAVFCMVFIGVCGFPSWYFLTGKKKETVLKRFYMVVLGVGALVAVAGLMLVLPLLKGKLSSSGLDVLGNQISIGDRLTLFFQWFGKLATDTKCEEMINGQRTSVAPIVVTALFILMQILYFTCYFVSHFKEKRAGEKNDTVSDSLDADGTDRKIMNMQKIIFLISFYIIFYLCSLLFISRMQPQHFVPLLFLMPLVAVAEMYELLKAHRYLAYPVLGAAGIVLLILSGYDHIRFHEVLEDEEGVKSYSIDYTELAEIALDEYEHDKKTVWLFADPGFYPTFIYLTENEVPTDILYGINGDTESVARFKYFSDRGYDINIVSNGNAEEFDALLSAVKEQYGSENVQVQEYRDNKRNYLFARIMVQ